VKRRAVKRSRRPVGELAGLDEAPLYAALEWSVHENEILRHPHGALAAVFRYARQPFPGSGI